MAWKIEFTTSSEKEFSKLTKDIKQSIYQLSAQIGRGYGTTIILN